MHKPSLGGRHRKARTQTSANDNLHYEKNAPIETTESLTPAEFHAARARAARRLHDARIPALARLLSFVLDPGTSPSIGAQAAKSLAKYLGTVIKIEDLQALQVRISELMRERSGPCPEVK